MNVKVIRVDGSEEDHQLPTKNVFSQIYKLIGCDGGDGFNLRDGRSVIVDDTGMIDGKPINNKATKLYHAICRPGTTHCIHGDVAIVNESDFA